ncbi:MAG: hypothetical protein ACNA8W_22495 [Bradymonadaceae bacterium]
MPWKCLLAATLLTPLVLLTSFDARACQPIPSCTITSGSEDWPPCLQFIYIFDCDRAWFTNTCEEDLTLQRTDCEEPCENTVTVHANYGANLESLFFPPDGFYSQHVALGTTIEVELSWTLESGENGAFVVTAVHDYIGDTCDEFDPDDCDSAPEHSRPSHCADDDVQGDPWDADDVGGDEEGPDADEGQGGDQGRRNGGACTTSDLGSSAPAPWYLLGLLGGLFVLARRVRP